MLSEQAGNKNIHKAEPHQGKNSFGRSFRGDAEEVGGWMEDWLAGGLLFHVHMYVYAHSQTATTTTTTEEKMTPVFSTLFLYYCLTFSFQSTDKKEKFWDFHVLTHSTDRPTIIIIIIVMVVPQGNPPSYPRYYAHPLSWLPTLALERRRKAWKETSKQYNFFSGHIIYKSTTHEYRIIKMMMTRDVLLHLMGLPLDTL